MSLCLKPPSALLLPLGQACMCTPQYFVSSAPFLGSTPPGALSHAPLTLQAALPLPCCLNYLPSEQGLGGPLCTTESQCPTSSTLSLIGTALHIYAQLYFGSSELFR